MAEEVRIDESEMRYFESLCDDLAKMTKKATAEILDQQAGLFTRDAMRLTPPHSKNPISESYATQRKQGLAAVKNDVGLTFKPLYDYKVFRGRDKKDENLKRRLKQTVESEHFRTTKKILQNVGLNPLAVIKKATVQIYKSRGSSMRRQGRAIRVVEAKTVADVAKQLQGEVGKGKAGWLAAVQAFRPKEKVPQWITKHGSSRGYAIKANAESDKPFSTLANAVAYIQDRAPSIVARVWRGRTHALRNQIERIEDYYRRKAEEKMRRRGVEVT